MNAVAVGVGSPEVDASVTRPRGTSLRVWLLPPFASIILLLHVFLILWLRGASMLSDPGIGWHLATGRYILATMSIPTRDFYSYTAAGREWISYYWLFEVLAVGIQRVGGLSLYAAVCALVYGAIPVLLLRRMLRLGAGLLPAVIATLLAYVVLTIHAVARPHIVTYLCFALLLERLDRVQRGELPPRALWWIPPMMALWCNMHGGFVAGLTLAAIFAATAGLRWMWLRDREDGRRARVFAGLLVLMTLATFVNPVGPRLHLSILAHLRQQSAGYFNEFQSPNFLAAAAPVRAFECLVLLLVLLLAFRRAVTCLDAVLLVFFLDQALHSVRHTNLFAIVAAPIVARELTGLLDRMAPRVQARIAAITAQQARLRSHVVYYPLIAVAFLGVAVTGLAPFPATLDDLQLGKGAADFIARHENRFERMFNTDNLGGSLIYRFWPDLKVFFDDRVFVYGDDFIIHKYLPVLFMERGWRDVLQEYDVTAAVVTAKTGCDTLFRAAPDWELAFEDDHTSIFFPRANQGGRPDLKAR